MDSTGIKAHLDNGLRVFFLETGGFPGSSDGKESACNAGDTSATPGLGRSPGKKNGYPLKCSHL